MTSLGFGHVSAVICLAHPEVVIGSLRQRDRRRYAEAAAWRKAKGEQRLLAQMISRGEGDRGTSLFVKRTDRRFVAADGTAAQREEEAAMLLDPASRLTSAGRYGTGPAGEEPTS